MEARTTASLAPLGRLTSVWRAQVGRPPILRKPVSLAAGACVFGRAVSFRHEPVFFGSRACVFPAGPPRLPERTHRARWSPTRRPGPRRGRRTAVSGSGTPFPRRGNAAGTARLPPLPGESLLRPAALGQRSVVPVLRAPPAGAILPPRYGIGAPRRLPGRLLRRLPRGLSGPARRPPDPAVPRAAAGGGRRAGRAVHRGRGLAGFGGGRAGRGERLRTAPAGSVGLRSG